MAEIGDIAETHHAGSTLECMDCTTNTLDEITILRRIFEGSQVVTDGFEMLLGLQAEKFGSFFGKFTTYRWRG